MDLFEKVIGLLPIHLDLVHLGIDEFYLFLDSSDLDNEIFAMGTSQPEAKIRPCRSINVRFMFWTRRGQSGRNQVGMCAYH